MIKKRVVIFWNLTISITAIIFLSFLFLSCQKAKEPESKKEVQVQKEDVKQQPSEAKPEVHPKRPTTTETKEQQLAGRKEVIPQDKFLQSLRSMHIAYIADGDVWVMMGDGSDKKRVTKRGDVTVLFGWSYDNTRLLFGTGKLEGPPGMNAKSYVSGYTLWVVNLETREEQKFKDIAIIGARWVPQKEKIVFLAKDESLWIINSNSENSIKIVKCCASPDAFSPNGNEVAYVDIKLEEKNEEAHVVSSQVWIKNVESNISRQITHEGINGIPRWFPDGKKILFKSERKEKSTLWIINADGNNPVELKYPKFPIAADMVFPDGKHFVITSPVHGTTSIANIETGLAKRIIFDGKPGRIAILSPDGFYLLYISKNNEIRVINTEGTVLFKGPIGDYPYWANKWGGKR